MTQYEVLTIIFSALALLVSITTGIYSTMNRWKKITMIVTSRALIDGADNTLYLGLYLSIQNSSSITKRIDQIRFRCLEGTRIFEVPGEPNFELRTVTFRPFPGGKYAVCSNEDVYSLPLDVEPYHSKTVFLAVGVHPVPLSQFENSAADSQKIVGYLVGTDLNNNKIAEAALYIPHHSNL